ncbi:chemotaxis protein CheW [Pseudaquabacterium rugosum]|jgi:purine-binding chemotaxis protein CheW|uniref:Chemotaxis protein CheW n=1 Tax=Pseudaquabacterium rugosum TaxID=2984194 RepID=A0ABU9BAA5_9BURK
MILQATQTPGSSLPHGGAGEASQTLQQYLRFALGEERYAVRIDAVREILEVARMTPLPLMPAFVRGVMNLRGAVVPVIDLCARLGMASTRIGRRTCVVIVDITLAEDQGTQRLGMLVDAVYEVVDATPAELEPVPRLGTRIDPSFIRSMVRVRGQTTPELDIGNVLDQHTLAALIAEHGAQH